MCPFASQKCPFIFQNCPFVSWNCSFVFKKWLFNSQKCSIVFQNCPLVFQKCLLFVYCSCLFPRMPFYSWLYLLLVLLKAAQIDNCPCSCFVSSWNYICWPIYWIYLWSVLFWEEKLNPPSNHYQVKWFKLTSILDNVNSILDNILDNVNVLWIYSNFSLHDSLENVVSEHF